MRRLLLLRLVEDVDRPSWLVGNVGDVEAAGLVLANALNLLEVFLGELNLLEVLLDARSGDGLGDDRVAADLSPCKDDLRGGGLVLLGNLLDNIVLHKEGDTEHVVAESLGTLANGTNKACIICLQSIR